MLPDNQRVLEHPESKKLTNKMTKNFSYEKAREITTAPRSSE